MHKSYSSAFLSAPSDSTYFPGEAFKWFRLLSRLPILISCILQSSSNILELLRDRETTDSSLQQFFMTNHSSHVHTKVCRRAPCVRHTGSILPSRVISNGNNILSHSNSKKSLPSSPVTSWPLTMLDKAGCYFFFLSRQENRKRVRGHLAG